jgi:hypothetical protein
MQPIVRIDADQVRIECCMMNLRERQTVWNHRMAKLLILVGNDGAAANKRGSGRRETAQQPL